MCFVDKSSRRKLNLQIAHSSIPAHPLSYPLATAAAMPPSFVPPHCISSKRPQISPLPQQTRRDDCGGGWQSPSLSSVPRQLRREERGVTNQSAPTNLRAT